VGWNVPGELGALRTNVIQYEMKLHCINSENYAAEVVVRFRCIILLLKISIR
jgi:hypothetical protein